MSSRSADLPLADDFLEQLGPQGSVTGLVVPVAACARADDLLASHALILANHACVSSLRSRPVVDVFRVVDAVREDELAAALDFLAHQRAEQFSACGALFIVTFSSVRLVGSSVVSQSSSGSISPSPLNRVTVMPFSPKLADLRDQFAQVRRVPCGYRRARARSAPAVRGRRLAATAIRSRRLEAHRPSASPAARFKAATSCHSSSV